MGDEARASLQACEGTGGSACAVVVRVVILGGLVADAVLVWVGTGVADDVPRRAEVHEAENQVGMWAGNGADGHARVACDLSGGIGWVWDGC